MSATGTAERRPFRDEALLAWLEEHDRRFEVIAGTVLVSPPDRLEHSERGLLVAAALLQAAPAGLRVLGPSYGVYYDPAEPEDFVMPDVLVARDEDCGSAGLRVPPLLVVEVLSPSTRRRDRTEKRDIYAALGVPHYWLLDPERHTASALRLDGDRYAEVLTAVGELVVDDPFPVRLPL